ncbi:polyphenol oxidase family protein [bacterium]|nr:polyphenol oxidase family protein [bacterium]
MLKARLTAIKNDYTIALLLCENTPRDPLPEGLEYSEIELPNEPLVLRQVHGGTVHYIDSVKVTEETRGAFGDGFIVTKPGIAVGVITADCIPLVITEAEGRCVAVLHCGWKSLATGIVDNALSLILNTEGVRKENLRFVMGPGILGSEYEVGPEVAVRFPESTKLIDENKYLLDLPVEIAHRLSKYGIESSAINSTGISTFSNEWLPSYRRDGDKAGQILILAWIK